MQNAMQLVGEVHELGVCTAAGRQHLVGRLLELVGAAVGGAVHDTGYGPGMKCGIRDATLAGFDREILGVFNAHQTEGSDYNPFHQEVMKRLPELRRDSIFTSTNAELVERKTWNGSEWINEYVRPARIDHFLGSMRILGDAQGIGFGLMRGASDRPFSDEDRDVLHLVHLGVGPFFDIGSTRARLAPRVRATLDELLTGATDKEIAARLSISPHTVRQYVKTILRAYGVQSRTQLIARAAP